MITEETHLTTRSTQHSTATPIATGHRSPQRGGRVLLAGTVGLVAIAAIGFAPPAAFAGPNFAGPNFAGPNFAGPNAVVTPAEISAGISMASGQLSAAAVGSGIGVHLPAKLTDGVVLGDQAHRVTVLVPGAKHAGKATKIAHGATAYSGSDHSANAVIPTGDGGAQFLTVINGRQAPTQYTYELAGGRATVLPGGGALVTSGGKVTGVVLPPWARDADGQPVPSHFVVSGDGQHLTQVVEHRGGNIRYPVTADPSFRWYWNGVVVTLSRGEMAAVAISGSQALIPLVAVPGIGWSTIVAVLGASAYASWAYANHKCLWFWLVYFVVGSNWGFYDC
jgi:hypothetical protein